MAPPRPWRPFACFAVFGLFWGGWGALLPSLVDRAGVTDAQLGFALLLLALAALPAMLAAGLILDRARRPTLGIAAGAFAIAAIPPGFAHSLPALAATAAVVGMASGAMDVTMNAAVAAEEARLGRRLMHAAHAAFSGSVVVSSVSVGLARNAGAEPLAVLVPIAAVVMAVAILVQWSSRPEGLVPENARDRSGSRPLLAGSLLVLGFLCALAYLVENALQSWSALHLERTLHASPAIGGLGPGLFAAAAALGRLGAQGIAARRSDRAMVRGAAIVGALGTGIAAFAPSWPVALVGVLAAGAGISIAAPTIFGLTGRLVGAAERGRAMSTVTTIAYLGFLFGPPLVGSVASAVDLRWALGLVAGVALLLGGLAQATPRARVAPLSP